MDNPKSASPYVQPCIEAIDEFYGKRRSGEDERRPKALLKVIEQLARSSRDQWDARFMRALWPAVARGVTRRSRSLEHEVAWFTLAGFILRPGFGDPLDPVRMAEAWRVRELGLSHPKENAARGAECIFWRRISGGLDEAQQSELAEAYRGELVRLPSYGNELIRVLGSLERLSQRLKHELMCDLIRLAGSAKPGPLSSTLAWALERIGGRVPVYGEVDSVIPGISLEPHLAAILALPLNTFQKLEWQRLLVSLARRTGDGRCEISEERRAGVQKKLRSLSSPPEVMAPLTEVVELERRHISYLLGDDLPSGIEIAL